MRVVNDQVPTPFRDIQLDIAAAAEPARVRREGREGAVACRAHRRHAAAQPHDASRPSTSSWRWPTRCPPASTPAAGVEEYVRTHPLRCGPLDDFRLLQNELYLAATDLDTCERIVFGAEGWDDVPISSAVRASTALPMLYKPHVINGREFIDGGIVSTTNLDIAVEAGAKFVVVVNPLVPLRQRLLQGDLDAVRLPSAPRVGPRASRKIGYQTFKLIAYQRLHEMARHWEERYPGVDIVLIEPEPDDELMFETNIMNYASRIDVARHGFQSVTLKLAGGLRPSCARSARATASRSPPRACARWSSTSPPSARRPAPGGASSSRPPARCCASPSATRRAVPRRVPRSLTASHPSRAPTQIGTSRCAGSAGVQLVEDVRVLLVDHVALDLQRRRQLAGLLREVVVEDRELLDLLDLRVLLVDVVEDAPGSSSWTFGSLASAATRCPRCPAARPTGRSPPGRA